MDNIKTIEVIKPVLGLNVGDALTRTDGNSNFVHSSERAGEGYSSSNTVSVSADMAISLEAFKATEWFIKKTKNQRIEELQSELDMYKQLYNELFPKYIDLNDKSNKILKRIDAKLSEFETESKKLDEVLSDKFLSGERLEWADEASTVFYNMIDLLKKIKA